MSTFAIADCRSWLRLASDIADADALQLALDAAEAKLSGETGLTLADLTGDDLYLAKVAAYTLAGHWYENREASSPLDVREVPRTLRYIIDHLRGPEV